MRRTRCPLAGWWRWPRGWCGRLLPAALAALVTAELAVAGVPGPAEGVGVGLAGPVLIEHGTDALRERFIRRTVTGEITWCQLFSEPGAGSDLAGLSTRAEAVADHVDWHQVAALVRRGCPPRLALHIVM